MPAAAGDVCHTASQLAGAAYRVTGGPLNTERPYAGPLRPVIVAVPAPHTAFSNRGIPVERSGY